MQQSDTIRAPKANLSSVLLAFDHPAWNEASPVPINRLWSGEPAEPLHHATVQLLWSDESLLARFVCVQTVPLIANDNPDLSKKTIGLWDNDVCEIFLSPDPARPNYYLEFEAAPTGEWVDLSVEYDNGELTRDFNLQSGMKTSSRLANNQLTVLMAIPWSEVIPRPQTNDELRINLFRCIGHGNERYLAWQPTFTAEPNFHVPQAFGRVRFL